MKRTNKSGEKNVREKNILNVRSENTRNGKAKKIKDIAQFYNIYVSIVTFEQEDSVYTSVY